MAKHRKQALKSKPWYQQTAFLIGVAGIIILIGVFFVVNATLKNDGSKPQVQRSQQAQMEGEYQVIRMSVESIDYVPASFTVQQNIPVKFIIDGTRASGCTSIIVSRDFGFNKQLAKGENIIEFTPTEKGTFVFHCGMNMVQGTITVV